MRQQDVLGLEGRLKRVIARLNETGASPDAFDAYAVGDGAADLPGGRWSPRLEEDIVHWELILDGRVAARVFAPFRGGAWRYELFPPHERPAATDPRLPRTLSDVLRRLATRIPEAQHAQAAQAGPTRASRERLYAAEDSADAASAAYLAAGDDERPHRRAAYDHALAQEEEARRESGEADAAATQARLDARPARRGRELP